MKTKLVDFRIYSQSVDLQYIAFDIYIKKISICLIYKTLQRFHCYVC